MNDFVKVEDVQKQFDQLLSYEKKKFLEDNMWKEKLIDEVIETMMARYDKDEILERYYTEAELRRYIMQNYD